MSSHVTTPQPPKPPSAAEMLARMPGLIVYNPTDEWLQPEVHGRTDLYLCPDLGGAVEPHPIQADKHGNPVKVVCDGHTEIKSRFPIDHRTGQGQRDSSGKTIEGQDAHAVVSYLIHRERYGELGVVWFPGQDAEEDAGYKDHARQQWLAFRETRDEEILNKRREFKANWERNPIHKGEPCPPPTAVENAAMERSQEREHKKAYMYECDVPECPGYASNDWPKFARHMKIAHEITADRKRYEGEVGVTAEPVATPEQTEQIEAMLRPTPKKTRRRAKRG